MQMQQVASKVNGFLRCLHSFYSLCVAGQLLDYFQTISQYNRNKD